VTVLVAPDKFKDALDAEAVCAAMTAGIRRARFAAVVAACPLADGGEGTGRLLARATGADACTLEVRDPRVRPRQATWWCNAVRGQAIVEMAQASGLSLLAPAERSALHTTSFGTGELLHAAAESGVRHILLAVGGSATVDGGAGCLQALGWELRDAAGQTIPAPACGRDLLRIASIHPPDAPFSAEIDVLCDVENTLLGPLGAAPVFAPQKGATPAEVDELVRGLEKWADVLAAGTGREVRVLAGSGAAGGLPAGLAAALGARAGPGLPRVADAVGLNRMLASADLCLTGEGRIDDQTVRGKVVAGVAERALTRSVPVVAFVGSVRLRPGQTRAELASRMRLRDIIVISPPDQPLDQALLATAANLEQAVAEYLSG
jgi:glycerate kinase